MTPKRSVLAADAALLGVALFWGMGYVAMKAALDSFTPFWLTVFRSAQNSMAELTSMSMSSGSEAFSPALFMSFTP